jgi:hypothetical protein
VCCKTYSTKPHRKESLVEKQEEKLYTLEFTVGELLEIYEGLGQAQSKAYPGMVLEDLVSVRIKVKKWFEVEKHFYLR